MTAKMVVHPGREGIDAGAEFQALGLDGGGQIPALSLDGSRQVAYLCLDAGILSVEPVALGVDPGALSVDPGALRVHPGVKTRRKSIDPRAKVEEAAERSKDGSPEQPDRGPRHGLHRSRTVAPATDTYQGGVVEELLIRGAVAVQRFSSHDAPVSFDPRSHSENASGLRMANGYPAGIAAQGRRIIWDSLRRGRALKRRTFGLATVSLAVGIAVAFPGSAFAAGDQASSRTGGLGPHWLARLDPNLQIPTKLAVKFGRAAVAGGLTQRTCSCE